MMDTLHQHSSTVETRFRANIERVAAKDPALAQALAAHPLVNMQLVTNERGELVGNVWDLVTQRWITLAQPEDPWAEAEADAEALYTPQAKVFILFGLGLGYFAAAVAKRLRPYQRMAIFETRSSLYAAAMRAVDLAPILGERRVDTFIGDNLDGALQHWFLSMESHEKFHICQPFRSGFTQFCDTALYEQLLNRTLEMYRYHQVGLATWAQFGHCIGNNDLENLPEYCITPGMGAFAGAWQGRPAVCVAAGPSLSKNLHLLLDPVQRRKVAVICVGTCYALLKSLGIEPDLVTTIDFQELNWSDQFKDVPLDRHTPLLYLHSTYPTTARIWPGPRFVALNASDTTAWLAQFTEPKLSAAQVQTVAHLNLVAAYHLGASPVCLLGQDLSMPHAAHHAVGARVQDLAPNESADEVHVQTVDFAGQPVYTRQSFLSMKTVFQQLVAGKPETAVYNCTEGGLALDGVPNTPLFEVLQTLPEVPEDAPLLRDILGQRAAAYTPKTRWTDLALALTGMQEQLRGMQGSATQILAQYDQLPTLPDGPEKERLLQDLLRYDSLPGTYPQAFNQVAVRRFDMIQLLSAIPLPDGTSVADQQKYTVEKLVQVAHMIQAETPAIATLVTRTMQRMQDAIDVYGDQTATLSEEHIVGMLERQSYQMLRAWLLAHPATALQRPALLGALAMPQQMYHEVISFLRHLPTHADMVSCAEARLSQFAARGHHIRLHYYAQALLPRNGHRPVPETSRALREGRDVTVET